MLGAIKLEKFEGLTSMPQEAATAWSAVEGLCGAKFKPLLYLGTQVVRGINHWFIAEETLSTNPEEQKIVMLAINGFNGVYALVPGSIEIIVA